MKKAILLIYRIVYAAFSSLILAGAVAEVIRYRGVVAKSQIFLLSLFACIAAFMLFATFVLPRVNVLLLWAGTLLFCVFLAW